MLGVRRTGAPRVGSLLLGGMLGGAAVYFLDPVLGKLRRNIGRDRLASQFRHMRGWLVKQTRWRMADAYGVGQRVKHAQPEHWSVPNDATLAQRVESELFADRRVPKGAINVNAEAGIIVLRGQVDRPEQIREIEAAVAEMPGVRGVHNLLHLRGSPVPDRGSVLPAK